MKKLYKIKKQDDDSIQPFQVFKSSYGKPTQVIESFDTEQDALDNANELNDMELSKEPEKRCHFWVGKIFDETKNIIEPLKQGELGGAYGVRTKPNIEVEMKVGDIKIPTNPADKRQLRILIDTVKNPLKSFLGGPSEKESIKILKEKFGYTDSDILKLQK